MAHWQAGWEMATDHPIVGVGPGNYEAAYERYYLLDWREALGHAHNYYLNTFAELGAIGVVAFLGFLASVFGRLRQGVRRAARGSLERALLIATLGAFTAFCVHNMFDNMLIHGIGVQLGLILGLAEVAARGFDPIEETSFEASHAHRY
jgi:O-antigen ligase